MQDSHNTLLSNYMPIPLGLKRDRMQFSRISTFPILSFPFFSAEHSIHTTTIDESFGELRVLVHKFRAHNSQLMAAKLKIGWILSFSHISRHTQTLPYPPRIFFGTHTRNWFFERRRIVCGIVKPSLLLLLRAVNWPDGSAIKQDHFNSRNNHTHVARERKKSNFNRLF